MDTTRSMGFEPSGFGVRVPGGVQLSRSGPVHADRALPAGTLYGRKSTPSSLARFRATITDAALVAGLFAFALAAVVVQGDRRGGHQ